MTEQKLSLDIQTLTELFRSNLDSHDHEMLIISLQSIGKRLNYCSYHYDEFLSVMDQTSLVMERMGTQLNNGPDTRTVYEANALAFLHNVHGLLDSVPYALNLMFRTVPDIEGKNISWNKDFINSYFDYPFYNELSQFMNNGLFLQIKAYANKTKHKQLVRIKNTYNNLIFESFRYKDNHKNICTFDEREVREFMAECHNDLIPNCIELYKLFGLFQQSKIN